MFGRKNTLDVQELGIAIHKLVIHEVFRFLEHSAGKETLKSFNLAREELRDELIYLGQFAAWSALKQLLPNGEEDVMAVMYQAYYDELTRSGVRHDDLTELDSYLQKRFLALSIAEAKLSEDKFNEELVKLSAISVSKKDPPSEDLSTVLLIYYTGVRAQISAILSVAQLKEIEKSSDDILDGIVPSIAVDIFKEAVSSVNELEKLCISKGRAELATPQYSQITFEYLYLFVHFIDRIAFGLFGPEKRSEVLDQVYFWTNKIITENISKYIDSKFEGSITLDDKIKVNNRYEKLLTDKKLSSLDLRKIRLEGFDFEELNERNTEYSKYQVFTKDGELKRLLSVLSKNILGVIDKELLNDTIYEKFICELSIKATKNLEIQKKLEKVQR